MDKIKLHRYLDVNNNSGEGDVWAGVRFDNGYCVGGWRHRISSHGIYTSVESLLEIHGHEGNTVIKPSDYGSLFMLLPKRVELPVVQGYVFEKEMCAICFMNQHNNIMFYSNLEELVYIYRNKYELFKFNDAVNSDNIPLYLSSYTAA